MSESYYLIHMGGADIVQCPGDRAIAEKHLKELRTACVNLHRAVTGHDPETVPWLICVYPPETITGKSYGYTPTLMGNIDTQPYDWQPVGG